MITKNVFISRKPYHAPTVKIAEMDGERLMTGLSAGGENEGWDGKEKPSSAKSLRFIDATDDDM